MQIHSIWNFYRNGFRDMTWGRTLWFIILVKLFVLFFILKLFFFTPSIKGKSETEKQEFVRSELTERID